MKKDIDNQGLSDELKSAINKVNQLKVKFSDMLNVLGVSVYRAGDILAYTFLLPILGMLINVVNTFGVESVEFNKLMQTLLSSGLITPSSVVFRDVVQKIAKTISKK